MRTYLAIGCGLLIASTACAELRIAGDTKVSANKLVRLKAEGAPPGAAYIWDVAEEDRADVEELGSRLLFSAPPGTYKVKVRAVHLKDGQTAIETARVTVTIGNATPPPGPGPTPGGVAKWLLVVEETGDASPSRTLLADRALADRLKAKGIRHRLVDRDVVAKDGQPPADLRPWLERAKGKKLPWLTLVSGDGDILAEQTLPATAAELSQLLDKVGG